MREWQWWQWRRERAKVINDYNLNANYCTWKRTFIGCCCCFALCANLIITNHRIFLSSFSFFSNKKISGHSVKKSCLITEFNFLDHLSHFQCQRHFQKLISIQSQSKLSSQQTVCRCGCFDGALAVIISYHLHHHRFCRCSARQTFSLCLYPLFFLSLLNRHCLCPFIFSVFSTSSSSFISSGSIARSLSLNHPQLSPSLFLLHRLLLQPIVNWAHIHAHTL